MSRAGWRARRASLTVLDSAHGRLRPLRREEPRFLRRFCARLRDGAPRGRPRRIRGQEDRDHPLLRRGRLDRSRGGDGPQDDPEIMSRYAETMADVVRGARRDGRAVPRRRGHGGLRRACRARGRRPPGRAYGGMEMQRRLGDLNAELVKRGASRSLPHRHQHRRGGSGRSRDRRDRSSPAMR